MTLTRRHTSALAVLAVAYAIFLTWYHAPYAGGSDASGYMNSAQLLLAGELHTPLRMPAGFPTDLLAKDSFVPLGFRLDATRTGMVPTYPVGLPLHLVLIGWLTGLATASTIVSVGSALVFAALLFLVSRDFGVRPNWSVGVALLGALSPLTVMFSTFPMSDLPAAVWILLLILCARRAERGTGWAVAAGAAMAVAVLVRPTNLLLVVPALIALPARPRPWIAFGLGGLPGALFLAWYNHALYGSAITSGYGAVDELFSTAYFAPTVSHFAYWVPIVASPLILAAVALPWTSASLRTKAILVTWAMLPFGLYSVYFCTHETWWYLRFVLPALPALGIAAALVLQSRPLPTWHLASRLLPAGSAPGEMARGHILRIPLAALLLLGGGWWMAYWIDGLRATKMELDDRGYPLTGKWIAQELPDDAVLLAYQVSGAVLHYSPRAFIVPHTLSPHDRARLEDWLAQNRRPLYAALYIQEEPAVFSQFPGRWEKVVQLRQATVWRRLDPAIAPARPTALGSAP